MSRYLEKLHSLKSGKFSGPHEDELTKLTEPYFPTADGSSVSFGSLQSDPQGKIWKSESRYERIADALESGCPDLVPVARWQQAVGDGRRFLSRWGEQAEALGWTARDLFGLQTPPPKPHPSYSRLSRFDETGLIWVLQGREVVALTETTASIRGAVGNITIYRKHNKPALGPPGDRLDDLQ
jgi:hypothetical protein